MIRYGDVNVSQPSLELLDWLEEQIQWDCLHQALLAQWPGDMRARWPYPTMAPQPPPRRLNALWWPTGASRWAMMHLLICADDLQRLHATGLNPNLSGQTQPQTLRIGEGTTYRVETDLWMLPALPLAQIANEQPLYILPLVDDRFYWWTRAAAITVDGGTTTWADLLSSIATALGITITADTIASEYMLPAQELTATYQTLPVLLDAACYNIGHRFIAKTDGTYVTQTASTAKTSHDAQLTKWDKTALGTYALTS